MSRSALEKIYTKIIVIENQVQLIQLFQTKTNTNAIRLIKNQQLLSLFKQKLDLLGQYHEVFSKLPITSKKFKDYEKEIPTWQKALQNEIARLEIDISEKQKKVQDIREEKGLLTVNDYAKIQLAEEKYIDTLQKKAQAIYTTRGALCDNEGFYQHYGECWSDATQHVLLNQDGIKELLQKKFITEKDFGLDSMSDYVFVPIPSFQLDEGANREWAIQYKNANATLIQQQKKWVNIYMKEVQKRFLRHYTTEGTRREFLETCDPNQPALEATKQLQLLSTQARMLGQEGVSTAILGKFGQFVQSRNKEENVKQLRGQEGLSTLSPSAYIQRTNKFRAGTQNNVTIILNVFNAAVLNNTLEETYVHLETKGAKRTLAISLDSNIALLASIRRADAGHTVAMYTCGSRELFYEDNFGVFAFPWKTLLKNYTEIADAEIFFAEMEIKTIHGSFYTSFYPVLRYTKKGLFKSKQLFETYIGRISVVFEDLTFVESIGTTMYSIKIPESNRFILRQLHILEVPKGITENVGFPLRPEARLARKSLLQQLESAVVAKNIDRIVQLVLFLEENKIEIPASTNQSLRKLLENIEGEAIQNEDPMSPRSNRNFAPSPSVSEANNVRSPSPSFSESTIVYNATLNTPLDVYGWTPLMQAAKARDLNQVEELLARGADPNSKGSDPDAWGNGMTPLHAACIPEGKEDNSEVVTVLLKAGADVHATTNDGTTPLALASVYSHENVIKLLCAAGADPSIQGTDPWDQETPLTPSCPAATKGGKRFKKTRKTKRKRRGHTAKRR